MRCLYCGKPLPLLKKLTGGGEFCSDAHRHKYQEEYNKLALSRLLQAQSAPGEVGVFPAPGGGSGLRQLAAPAAPPQPIVGQRALPPPSTPTTAHHQEAKPLPPPPPPMPRAAAPPPPPPAPDPKEAPFLVAQHQPIGPAHAADILQDLCLSFEAAKPQFAGYESEAIPFDWEGTASAITASQEPDPPEAPAWLHPIAFREPGVAAPPQGAAFEVELFASNPLFPAQPDVSLGARFPQAVRPKIHLPIERAAVRVVPGVLRFSPVRDWELSLQAPEWRPSFVAIGAPAPPPQVVKPLVPIQGPVPVPAPVQAIEAEPPPPRPASAPPGGSVEVFVDLSALGIFE